MNFSQALLRWFDSHRREMPWREDPSPYRVWVSEIMLQQTRVSAVIPYFTQFIAALPDVYALADATEDALLLLWQGLGYYSRALNLQKAARIIVDEFAGQIPADYTTLLTLPGIGPYTAGAVASIAFGQLKAAVDGNVLRVFSRLLESFEEIQKVKTRRRITEEVEKRMPADRPGDYNQALMELGALICLPQNPLCGECPVRGFCQARRNNTQRSLPVRAKKKPVKEEKRTVFLLTTRDQLAIRKRKPTGLLKNMWEFVHTDGHLTKNEAARYLEKKELKPIRLRKGPAYTHVFSHRAWNMISYVVEVEDKDQKNEWIVADALKDYAIPSAFSFLLRAYLEE